LYGLQYEFNKVIPAVLIPLIIFSFIFPSRSVKSTEEIISPLLFVLSLTSTILVHKGSGLLTLREKISGLCWLPILKISLNPFVTKNTSLAPFFSRRALVPLVVPSLI